MKISCKIYLIDYLILTFNLMLSQILNHHPSFFTWSKFSFKFVHFKKCNFAFLTYASQIIMENIIFFLQTFIKTKNWTFKKSFDFYFLRMFVLSSVLFNQNIPFKRVYVILQIWLILLMFHLRLSFKIDCWVDFKKPVHNY